MQHKRHIPRPTHFTGGLSSTSGPLDIDLAPTNVYKVNLSHGLLGIFGPFELNVPKSTGIPRVIVTGEVDIIHFSIPAISYMCEYMHSTHVLCNILFKDWEEVGRLAVFSKATDVDRGSLLPSGRGGGTTTTAG